MPAISKKRKQVPEMRRHHKSLLLSHSPHYDPGLTETTKELVQPLKPSTPNSTTRRTQTCPHKEVMSIPP